MAFVSVSNPDGIQHNGGQMDWCRISATRVALLTHTKDNKAIVQEINYVDGATVIGTATFLKQIPAGGPTYRHLRSFVRDMGAGRLFVMVPTTFATMTAAATAAGVCAHVGLSYPATLAPACGTPNAYTCMTLQRNDDGTYTVDSAIDINMEVSKSDRRITRGMPIDIFINNTNILIRSPVKNTATTRVYNQWTLATTDGKITAQGYSAYTVGSNGGYIIMQVKEKRTPAGDVVRVYGFADTGSYTNQSASWYSVQGATTTKLIQNPYTAIADLAVPVSPSYNSGNAPLGMFLNPSAWLPISKTDPLNSLHVAGTKYFNNGVLPNYLNGNFTDGGIEMMNPLDVAWVTDTVACVAGFQSNYGADFVYPVLPGDIPFLLHPDYATTVGVTGVAMTAVRKLLLSFRNVAGQGLYIGPFDAIDSGYYAKGGMNEGDMIHRISDTAFWLIGCFMDSPTADPKLGVITVKA